MSGTSVRVIPSLTVTRKYPVPRERVFRAWTDRKELQNWFFPANGFTVPFAEINLRKNTRYRIAMRDKEGTLHLFGGVMQEVVVPEKLRFTWAQNAGGTQQHKSLVTVDFLDQSGTTELQLTHDNFPDDQVRTSYEQSWNHILDNLAKYLS